MNECDTYRVIKGNTDTTMKVRIFTNSKKVQDGLAAEDKKKPDPERSSFADSGEIVVPNGSVVPDYFEVKQGGRLKGSYIKSTSFLTKKLIGLGRIPNKVYPNSIDSFLIDGQQYDYLILDLNDDDVTKKLGSLTGYLKDCPKKPFVISVLDKGGGLVRKLADELKGLPIKITEARSYGDDTLDMGIKRYFKYSSESETVSGTLKGVK